MKEIPLTKGFVALVDDEDYEKLCQLSWRYEAGYAKTNNTKKLRALFSDYAIRSETVFMHRLLLRAPEGLEVDHKFLNTLDNQKAHLRLASKSQNQRNSSTKGGRSQFKGVYQHSRNGAWIAQIHAEIQHYLGIYPDEVSAALAYDRAAHFHFREFANYNFPANAQRLLPFQFPEIPVDLPPSGYTGVYPSGRKFVARAATKHCLGTFETAYDAALYRDYYVEKHNLTARLNF